MWTYNLDLVIHTQCHEGRDNSSSRLCTFSIYVLFCFILLRLLFLPGLHVVFWCILFGHIHISSSLPPASHLSSLHPSPFLSLPEKGLFILESEPLRRCITVDRSNLVLEDCERPTRRMLWKWVSRHRLFNLGTSTCLGLNISDTTQPLGTFECDTAHPVLWWRCSGNMLYGASQWKVAVAGRLVVVKKNSYHEWKRYNTPREGPCSYPYEGTTLTSPVYSSLVTFDTLQHNSHLSRSLTCLHGIFVTYTGCVLFADIHTLLGNAHGMPCALPFKYNNKWYSECTTEGHEDNLQWCATTTRYDEAERWGFCPVLGNIWTHRHTRVRKELE